MQISGLSGVQLGDSGLKTGDRIIPYSAVQSIHFLATVTQHNVNFIPTGRSYDATLRVLIQGSWMDVEPQRGMFGRLKKDGFEALQQAYSILAEITFTNRVERHENMVAERNYFEVADYQFHRSGHIFYKGREVGSFRDPGVLLDLAPFQLTLGRKPKSAGGRLRSMFSSQDVIIPLEIDRDCFLYMMFKLHGIRFKNTPISEKRRDRRKVFYEAVLRFGALLSKIDGSVDREEFAQLNRFFQLNEQKESDAAHIFKEELTARSNLSDILGTFAEEFDGADEVKEGFLLGMLSVALADGKFQPSEFELIHSASVFLKLTETSFARVLLTAGIDPDLFAEDAPEANRRDGAARTSTLSDHVAHLKVLGLTGEPMPEQIRTAYRQLVKRYHPDILRGQGMPELEIEKASKVLARINIAYHALNRER